jgi:hypothetical protein
MAADFSGRAAVSGLARGEIISLTLAPLLLVAMIILIRFGAGGEPGCHAPLRGRV